MGFIDENNRIATCAATSILSKLVYYYNIPYSIVFDFIEHSEKYKDIFNNDDVLILFYHDDDGVEGVSKTIYECICEKYNLGGGA